MYLRAGVTEAEPPLSTIFGNLGANSDKFCEEFNFYTKGLGSFFIVKTNITIFVDKTFEFIVSLPTASFFIRMLIKEDFIYKKTMGGLKKQVIEVIDIEDFLYIVFVKCGYINFNSIKILLGTLRSMNVYIDIPNVKKKEM